MANSFNLSLTDELGWSVAALQAKDGGTNPGPGDDRRNRQFCAAQAEPVGQ